MANSQLRKFANDLAKVKKLAIQAATQPQLAYSSIEDGAIESRIEGVVRAIFGQQFDGTHGSVVVNGPKPPVPQAPTAVAALEGARISWNGMFVGNAIVPLDFARVEVHASIDPDFTAEYAATLIGTFESPRGGEFYANLVPTKYYIKLVARSLSGNRSDASTAVEVTPQSLAVAIPEAVDAKPDASPELQVVGNKTGMTVVARGMVEPTTILDYYLDDILVISTRSTVLNWTTNVAGEPMVPDTDYSWRVVARNARGSAEPSPTVSGRVDLGVDAEVIIGQVSAGFVLAGTIQVGTNIVIDPDIGIKIELTNNGLIHFPSDGSPATITGKLWAQELESRDRLTVHGILNKVVGGIFASNGVTRPGATPTATTDWTDPQTFTKVEVNTTFGKVRGLYDAGSYWIVAVSLFGGSILFIDKTTGRSLGFTGTAEGLNPTGGVTRVFNSNTNQNEWIVFGQLGDGTWMAHRHSDNWTKIGEWKVADPGAISSPAMAVEGTSVFISYWSTSQARHRVREYSAMGDLIKTDEIGDTFWTASRESRGLYVGNADFGARRYVLAHATGVRVYSAPAGPAATRTLVASQGWTAGGGEEIIGLSYDGTRFHSLGLPSGKVYHYSRVNTATPRVLTYTWYDEIGTPHETDASDATTWTQPARQWMRVTAPLFPSPDPAREEPTSIRIYIANRLQPDLGQGINAATYDIPLAGSGVPQAPLMNNFPVATTPGFFTSTFTDARGALWRWNGDGTGVAGPLGWLANRGGVRRSDFATAASGWTVTSQNAEEFGLFKQGNITVTRTGSAISVGASGNVTNEPVCTLPAGWAPWTTVSASTGATGRLAGAYVSSLGEIVLSAAAGTSDIANGESLSFAFAYFATMG